MIVHIIYESEKDKAFKVRIPFTAGETFIVPRIGETVLIDGMMRDVLHIVHDIKRYKHEIKIKLR